MEERFGGKLTNLMIAGGAVIFVNMFLPLLDSLTSMAISAVNKTVNQWQLDMELDRREAEAAAEVISPTGAITQAIGFQIPSESYDDEYYEDKACQIAIMIIDAVCTTVTTPFHTADATVAMTRNKVAKNMTAA